ncbi:hypothetical protein AAFX24_17510 [Vibrio mediterranei]|uniref:hypothetical protein n=1 Tax=Vibrio mediterranei TaxID=689 RepID=UPI0038CEA5C2
MNLASFTLASTLRLGFLLVSVPAAMLTYDHYQTEARFERTVARVMQAMEGQLSQTLADTGCLHVPANPTIAALEGANLLDRAIQAQSPWDLSIAYVSDADTGLVMAKTLTLQAHSASAGERLKSLVPLVVGSWRYDASTWSLNIHRGVRWPTYGVDQLEFNPQTACMAW